MERTQVVKSVGCFVNKSAESGWGAKICDTRSRLLSWCPLEVGAVSSQRLTSDDVRRPS